MNIAICVKHAIDEAELRADASGKPQTQGAMTKMSSFDRNAIEEALRVREAKGGSITVFGLGGQDSKKTLKEALAMGCDRAVAIAPPPPPSASSSSSGSLPSGGLDTLATSYYLSRAIEKRGGGFDLVLLSEGSSDTYHGLVPPMLASWLGLPFVGYARKIQLDGNSLKAEVALDEKTQVVQTDLPVVVSVVSEINTPRYPTLLQIMQASKKPMEDMTAESLRDERAPPLGASVVDVTMVPMDRKKVVYEGGAAETAKQLVDALRKEGAI